MYVPSGINKFLNVAKDFIERIIFSRFSSNSQRFTWLLLILVTVGVAALIIFDTDGYFYNCLAIPVFLACLLMHRRGLIIVALALVLLVFSLWMCHLDWLTIVTFTSLELFKWCVMVVFTLVAVENALQEHNHRLVFERDIEMARTLQKALIPQDFSIGRVSLCGTMEQCRSVGGDFYYFRPFQEKYVVFCLGDVMGKGTSASMVMSIVMGFVFEWGKKSTSPSFILSKLNKRLCSLWRDDHTWFTTLFYAVYDEETSLLTYTSGAHDTALLLRQNGEIEHFTCDGLPIGAFEEAEWEDKSVEMVKGDRVILFTDGVTEARDSGGEFFGLERAIQLVKDNYHLDSKSLMQEIRSEIKEFTGGHLSDDSAILVVEIKS
ncbi:serine/threonine-protein phosphatase [bacterium]|nr:serine/threonine-protein phosphatase [bacterium]